MKDKALYIQAYTAVPAKDSQPLCAPLTCEIKAASMVCLLGQRINTINAYMQMLAGIIEPMTGSINHTDSLLDNADKNGCPAVAYLYHDTALLSYLNGIDNIKLPALYHQIAETTQIDNEVSELLDELEYEADHQLLPAFMNTLQKRYLLIVRTIILKPKILFIENPFANLDREQVRFFGKYLYRLVNGRNITVITSNANLDFVQVYADQMIYLTSEAVQVFSNWNTFSQYIKI